MSITSLALTDPLARRDGSVDLMDGLEDPTITYPVATLAAAADSERLTMIAIEMKTVNLVLRATSARAATGWAAAMLRAQGRRTQAMALLVTRETGEQEDQGDGGDCDEVDWADEDEEEVAHASSGDHEGGLELDVVNEDQRHLDVRHHIINEDDCENEDEEEEDDFQSSNAEEAYSDDDVSEQSPRTPTGVNSGLDDGGSALGRLGNSLRRASVEGTEACFAAAASAASDAFGTSAPIRGESVVKADVISAGVSAFESPVGAGMRWSISQLISAQSGFASNTEVEEQLAVAVAFQQTLPLLTFEAKGEGGSSGQGGRFPGPKLPGRRRRGFQPRLLRLGPQSLEILKPRAGLYEQLPSFRPNLVVIICTRS
eukprot:SAG31_NODE_441_length_15661_cov_17.905423_11_plen_372_part_00